MLVKSRAPKPGARTPLKHREHCFQSADAMARAEIEIMNEARKIFQYIPKVLNYDPNTQEITFEKIEGSNLTDYVYHTGHIGILHQLKDSAELLRFKQITLKLQGPERYSTGYISYHNYSGDRFIVDKNEKLWWVDWSIAGLLPEGQENDIEPLFTDLYFYDR